MLAGQFNLKFTFRIGTDRFNLGIGGTYTDIAEWQTRLSSINPAPYNDTVFLSEYIHTNQEYRQQYT
jgi:hypothetical protein